MPTNDPAAILAVCQADRSDLAAQQALADRIQDDDGDTSAVAAALLFACETCRCPDTGEEMAMDRFFAWHRIDDVHSMNSDHGVHLFGDYFPEPVKSTLAVYRGVERWHLVCPACRRKLIAAKAHATRKTNRMARMVVESPSLFD